MRANRIRFSDHAHKSSSFSDIEQIIGRLERESLLDSSTEMDAAER